MDEDTRIMICLFFGIAIASAFTSGCLLYLRVLLRRLSRNIKDVPAVGYCTECRRMDFEENLLQLDAEKYRCALGQQGCLSLSGRLLVHSECSRVLVDEEEYIAIREPDEC